MHDRSTRTGTRTGAARTGTGTGTGTSTVDEITGGGTGLITVSGLSHRFAQPDGTALTVLDDVSLTINEGEFVAIVGPSGCGKTTLLNVMSGLEEPTTGTVSLRGGPPVAGAPGLGYLFARDTLLPWRTVLGNAELAMELRGVGKAERRERAREFLAAVGIDGFLDAYPAQLSQGMRQRAAIARTLADQPSVLFLDEPFSALDAHTKLQLQDTFAGLWQGLGSTVVLITHDLGEAIGLADRVVVFTKRPGRIKTIFEVDLPRPRSMVELQGDDRFHRTYEKLWNDLRDEVG